MSQKTLVEYTNQPLLVGGSPANHLALLENERAKEMLVISGLKCYESSKNCNQLGSLEKTLLTSSVWNSTMRLLTWKTQVTKLDHLIFRLSASAPGIKGNGVSLLPTPDTMPEAPNKSCNRKYPKNLLQAAQDKYTPDALFPTPRSREIGAYAYPKGDHSKKVLTLTGVVTLFPTPSALNGHNCGTFQEWGGAWNKLRGLPIASSKVNPVWEEWLMGFPKDWTNLDDKTVATLSETRLSRNKSTQSSKQLQKLKRV